MASNSAQTQGVIGEDYQRTSGENARRYNLLASKLIAEIVRNSFGPTGLDKVLIDILGEVTITKSGSTILRKIDVDHPAAKALIDASNSVDNEVGDGTISVVILAGALLGRADKMLNQGIPPAVIMDGYLIAMELALRELSALAQKFENNDEGVMEKLVQTCLNSKVLGLAEPGISRQIISAVNRVADFDSGAVEVDDIKIEEKPGNMSQTELFDGIVIDKTVDNGAMPKTIRDAKILLLDDELESKTTRTDSQINVSRPDQLGAFRRQEMALVRSKVDHIIDSGANVVFSRQGINPFAQVLLAKAGIMSVKRVKENDLIWLAKATGANISGKLDHASDHRHHHDHGHGTFHESHSHAHDNQHYHHGDIDVKLGYAKRVYEKFVGDDRVVIVDGCRNPKAVSLLLRADSKRTLDECHRAALRAITVLRNFVRDPRVVQGGGSTEAEIAKVVRNSAKSQPGKVQVAVDAFADALEEIPLTLARNAGMDVVDALTALRHFHSGSRNGTSFGIDVANRKVADVSSSVIESLPVKDQVIKSAVEVANLIIRVDDVLMAKPATYTHTHDDGTRHSHKGGDKEHRHDYFDRLGKKQRPSHHYY